MVLSALFHACVKKPLHTGREVIVFCKYAKMNKVSGMDTDTPSLRLSRVMMTRYLYLFALLFPSEAISPSPRTHSHLFLPFLIHGPSLLRTATINSSRNHVATVRFIFRRTSHSSLGTNDFYMQFSANLYDWRSVESLTHVHPHISDTFSASLTRK